MNRRAEFSESTKAALAKRAGYRCAFPGCRAITIGPSAESPEQSASSGMACHIYAASDGPSARRRNPNLTVDKLRSIENGIWMCYSHGKLIDTDESTFPPEALQHWRKLAEAKARIRQAFGADLSMQDSGDLDIKLPSIKVEMSPADNISKLIQEIFFNSCINEVWGDDLAYSIRELTIELARNAFLHGHATTFEVDIDACKVTLSDNGKAFSFSELLSHTQRRGGAAAAKQVSESFLNKLIYSYIQTEHGNKLILARIRASKEISAITPCNITIDFESHKLKYDDVVSFCECHTECGTVYIVPKYGISHSDIAIIAEKMKSILHTGQTIVLVCEGVSSGLEEYITKIAPNMKLMRVTR